MRLKEWLVASTAMIIQRRLAFDLILTLIELR